MCSSLQDEDDSSIENVREELDKRKIEWDAAVAVAYAEEDDDAAVPAVVATVPAQVEQVARKKKKKNNKIIPIPNENHMKVRACLDACNKWEKDLQVVHGLSNEEASMVLGIASKHYNNNAGRTFPAFDETATRGIDYYRSLAKPGWQHFKQLKQIMIQYPRECAEQTWINGTWKMLPYDL